MLRRSSPVSLPLGLCGRSQEANGLWDDKAEAALRTETRKRVVEAFAKAEKRPKPPVSELFTDVYDVPPPLLREQEAEMRAHIAKYPKEYPLDAHAAQMAANPHSQPKPYL